MIFKNYFNTYFKLRGEKNETKPHYFCKKLLHLVNFFKIFLDRT